VVGFVSKLRGNVVVSFADLFVSICAGAWILSYVRFTFKRCRLEISGNLTPREEVLTSRVDLFESYRPGPGI
jgi:hypothetical protein